MKSHPIIFQNPDFSALECGLSLIADPQHPSPAEKENLWNASVDIYRAAILAGHKASKTKKELAAWLWQHTPGLGKSQEAIFRQLYRKIGRVARGGNLADKRREANKRKCAAQLSQADRKALIQCAVFECGGIIDFAWQTCLKKKLLSGEILKRYPAPKNHRPRCPKAIRRQIAAEVQELYQHHVRPHFNSNNIAPMTRDWSNVFAQDCYEIDDKTLDVLCRVTDKEKGEQIEREIRCQFLPLVDSKSGKVLDFVLIGEATYNAVSIRTLITRGCKKFGLPGMFLFENGIFKNAKLLGNNAKNKAFAEVENFATRLGVPIRHALPGRARTKIVETVLRLLDRFMVRLPGYIGNDEMHLKHERARDRGLYAFDEMFDELVEIVDEYNNTKSDSIVKGGYLTPNETWEKSRRLDPSGAVVPVVQLPPQFEYLLAEHCAKETLRQNGVKVRLGRETYHFHSLDLVDLNHDLIGQWVNVWFSPQEPQTAIVTDLKEDRYFPVERVPNAPARAETPGQWQMVGVAARPYRAAMHQIRQRYSDLKQTYVAPGRLIIADPTARVKAQRMAEAKKEGKQIIRRTQIVSTEENRLADETRRAESLRTVQQFEREHADIFQ